MGEETDTVISSTSKLRDKIKALTAKDGVGGVDILDSLGNYRDIYDIYDDISKVWNDMDKSSPQAADLLETLAGKLRSSDLAGLLNNFSTARAALNDAMFESDGSAMKEYSTWQKSLEAKSKKLEASAQRFSQAFVGNGPVGAVYDVLTGIVDGFSGITESVGGFTAAMTALSPVITKFFPQLGIAYVQYAPLREIPVAA